MHIIAPWETQVILWLRAVLPDLLGPFEAITALGGETFFLVLLPLITWCIDRPVGARVTLLYLGSAYANGLAKLLFDMPRPLDDAQLLGLFPEGAELARERYDATGNGFPSGHTQSSVVVWGYLAAQVSRVRGRLGPAPQESPEPWGLLRPFFVALAALLIILVPLSRIYLAVHYPRDVLGGYVFGLAALWLFTALAPRAETRLTHVPFGRQLSLAVALPTLAALMVPDEITSTAAGALLGMSVGFVMERHWVRFTADGPLVQRAERFLLGMAVLTGLYAGLRLAFGALEPHLLFRFIRYAVLGLWGAFGAPWCFVTLGLAPVEKM